MVKPPPPQIWKDAIFELPEAFNIQIGRLVTRTAYLESALQAALWKLMGVETSVGRYAVREPRVQERLDMIRDVAQLRGIPLDVRPIPEVRLKIERLYTQRDRLVHGHWVRADDGAWLVIVNRGAYPKSYNAPFKNRSAFPEGMEMTPEMIEHLVAGADSIIVAVHKLQHHINDVLRSYDAKSPTR